MKRQVLILCTANSARSQMAEGLLRALAGDRLEVASAGSRPSRVHPLAISVMDERGIDLRAHRSKGIDELKDHAFDDVITVCDHAAQSCPSFPGKARRTHWGLPDPAAAEGGDEERLAAFRQVRDTLSDHLEAWLEDRAVEP